MKIHIFPAKHGDAFLVSLENQYHILIDGGVDNTYNQHLKPFLFALHHQGQVLSNVIVTHLYLLL